MTPQLAVARADATVEVWETRHSPVLRIRIGGNQWEKPDLLKSGMRLTLSAPSSLQVPHLASKPALSAWPGELAGSIVVDFMDRLSTLFMLIAAGLTNCFLGC